MAGGGRSTSATSSPSRTVTSAETKEILKFTQSRKELYPNIKSADDLKDKKYADLMRPLKKKPAAMPKYAKEFYDRLIKLEGHLGTLALNNFTYETAKRTAKPSEKIMFSNVEDSINSVITANPPQTGGGYLPRPDLNALFSALTLTEFNTKMNDLNIVNKKFAQDSGFRSAADALMRHIIKYRKDNADKLKQDVIYAYLDEIFSQSEDKIEDTIAKSKIIDPGLIKQVTKAKIEKGWHEYHAYRENLEKRFKLEGIVNKEKQTIFSKPIEYARSGSRWVAQQIQKFRENWAGMDGKERVVAGATLLVGLAWFLNSENEEAAKFKDALKKALTLGGGYLALNTTFKAFTGRTLSNQLGNKIDDLSGKRDFLKESFSTTNAGAENLSYAIAYIGNYDFTEVGNIYMDQYRMYNDPSNNTKDSSKELPIGGVAEQEMNSNQLYKAVRLVDRKLKKQGSSIEQVVSAIEQMKGQAQAEGKSYSEPSFAMIVAAVLMNQDLKFRIKDGKIETVKTKAFDVKWTDQDRQYSKGWWAFTGKPYEWKAQLAGKFPDKRVKTENLANISKDIMAESRPLDKYITKERFGRYTKGLKDLYNLEIKNKPGQNVHTLVTTEGIGYMSSLVTINPNLKSKNMAYVAAIKSAYEQGKRRFENDLQKNNPTLYAKIKGRISEFFQPVGGVAMAPSRKKKGEATPTKYPKKYRLFCRFTLPNSQEFNLRLGKEWPQGDMMSQMKESILKPGETLTRGDFNTISRETVIRKASLFSLPIYDGYDSKFAGAYESFLANVGLKKSEKPKIDKVLEFYSRKFANSGLTKRGLIRYLATHQFTAKEIKEALGASITHFDYIVNVVRNGTKLSLPPAMLAKVPSFTSKYFVAIRRKNEREIIEREIFSKLGTVLILACYGDKAALDTIKTMDKKLHQAVVQTFGIQAGKSTKSPSRTEFINKVMPHYMLGVALAFTDKSRRQETKKAVAGYLATY